MLHKQNKDLMSSINHCSISPFNTLSNIFERLLLSRLKIQPIQKIRPEQYGSKQKNSTTLQLINILDNILISRNLQHNTMIILLDVEH